MSTTSTPPVWRTLALLAALFASALLLVHSRYQTRVLFAKLENLSASARTLDADWAALNVARGRLAQRTRIDHIARSELGMVPVSNGKTHMYELVMQSGNVTNNVTSNTNKISSSSLNQSP